MIIINIIYNFTLDGESSTQMCPTDKSCSDEGYHNVLRAMSSCQLAPTTSTDENINLENRGNELAMGAEIRRRQRDFWLPDKE